MGRGNAVVYGVLTDGSLWEHGPAAGVNVGWALLSPANTILAVAAAGKGQAFALANNHNLWQHTALGWSLTSTGSFSSLSGEQTANGAGMALGVLTNGSEWEYGTSWTEITTSGAASSSAAGSWAPASLQAQITGLPASSYSPKGTQLTVGSLVSGGVGTETYSWTVTQGGTTVTTGTALLLAFTPPGTGTYQVSLKVTDYGEEHNVCGQGLVLVDQTAYCVAG